MYNKTTKAILYKSHRFQTKKIIQNGLNVVKIHSALEFKQSDWLKQYIDLNTYLRPLAQNDFEKAIEKLLNNNIYAKSLENLDKGQTSVILRRCGSKTWCKVLYCKMKVFLYSIEI